MSASNTSISAAKEQLRLGRERLRKRHDQGTPGIQICAQMTDLMDSVLLDLYRSAMHEVGDNELESVIAMVAHGGYGRRDVAPYSDVDLMLLHAPGADEQVAPLARQFTHRLYDIGLQLGFTMRTTKQACQWAVKDAAVFTSLTESRLLTGNQQLFEKFRNRYQKLAYRRRGSFITAVQEARREERTQYGESVYMLEPNVKRSEERARDLQLLRWIGFACFGETDPEALQRKGALHGDDRRRLQRARALLLRARNELHFHAGKSQDVLDKREQLRIAELYGYMGYEGVLPVEQFMREYFERTSDVRYLVSEFVNSARPRSLTQTYLGPLVSRRADHDYHVGPLHIRANRRGRQKLQGDLGEVLRLMELANLTVKRIDHDTWEFIRSAMRDQNAIEMTSEAAERFLSLISQPGRLSGLLRRLHQLRVLERLIPPMAHARCLLQFNQYHQYTVDEHSLRAVEAATRLIDDSGPLGDAYRGIRQKRTLHLALLLHDLGKGYSEDHSDLGARLAKETCVRLGLPDDETETVEFLVQNHLRMSHIAFRQDLQDESLIVKFAVEVGSPDVLQMLYVLTAADVAAVGPGVLNSWKLELLTDLYRRTRRHLAGDDATVDRATKRREAVAAQADVAAAPDWWNRQIEALPTGLLFTMDPMTICQTLERVRETPDKKALAWGRFAANRNAVEYAVAVRDARDQSMFHKLTGALSSKGMQILAAEIHSLADNLMLDRFYVQDLDFSGEPPPERINEVRDALVHAVHDTSGEAPSFRRIWRSSTSTDTSELSQLPTRVRFDNSTSENFTIVTIFAYDRMGLLYNISRSLFELDLCVSFAKIGTYIDQVVDVFYVTDQDGAQITDSGRLDTIRSELLSAIANLQSVEA